jgi:hypothetical protein
LVAYAHPRWTEWVSDLVSFALINHSIVWFVAQVTSSLL